MNRCSILSRFAIHAAFLSLVLGLVGCGGLRMTREYIVAKDAVNKQDWNLAKELLEKEVSRDRANYEAWYYLGVTYQKLGEMKLMNDAYTVAERGLTDDFKTSIARARFSAWAEDFNTSVEIYNRYADNGDTSRLGRAIDLMKRAKALKPEYPENSSVLGMLYEARQDTSAMIEEYELYIQLQKKSIDFALSKGLYVGMTRKQALSVLGSPVNTQYVMSGVDSLATDQFAGRDVVYLSSIRRDNSDYVVEGWRVNPPVNWTKEEKERYGPLNTRPISQLASIVYKKNELDRALAFTETIAMIRPEDEQSQSLRVQIYNEQGKVENALKLLDQLVVQNPTNKVFICNYALALLRLERYDDAVVQYEKVLNLDPDFDIALLNCAAALKNKAIILQKAERDMKLRDNRYRENEQRYFPLLYKAAELFERYRELSAHREELAPMEHLVNIYDVTGDKTKVNQVVADLEAAESTFSGIQKYWELLGGVYSRAKQTDRAERAYRKADEVKVRNK
ncbi:MAG: tetratricopeptide repeat protein [Candidatus Kapaibacterium sp.]|jgi:tetratricopeptide (TPR) repeat protein